MPCRLGSVRRPAPAQNLTMPRLSPEHRTKPGGQSGRRMVSKAAPAARASAVLASAPDGTAQVVVMRRTQGAAASS
eukprot:8113782-Lingulodinium_polyedra.AAC.1